MRKIAMLLALIMLTTSVSGCILRLRLTNGGSVESSSGLNNCGTSTVCEVQVVDIFFDDTFTAVPGPGFVFAGWRRGENHLCVGRRDSCRLFTSGFEGNDALQDILASNEVYVLDPDFINLANVLPGTWEGQWDNLTFGSTGGITLTISLRNNGSFDYTVDIDGFVFGQADPAPVSGNFRADGAFTTETMIPFNGQMLRFVLSLSENGILGIEIPNLPIPGLDSFEASGPLNRRNVDMEYSVNFTTGSPAVGTIEIRKS